MSGQFGDLTLTVDDDMVATVEMHRPPNNFFDITLIRALADIYQTVDDDPRCRAIVLSAEGKHFCAGADFTGQSTADRVGTGQGNQLYVEAVRLFAAKTPVVAAVQGGAIGGGLGLACSADFRVGCPEARFAANFSRLGFHHGFGLSATLPRIVGNQHTLDMLYTGRRVPGEEAFAMGLCDRLVPLDQVRTEAHAMAVSIARSAPLAIRSIRETMRGDLAEAVRLATDRENHEQDWLRSTADWTEGVRASAERREPSFVGR
jgi:2-(1,2-epoxy-1,2-dihydrophenyl)acetyl-CoA isomerase